MRIPAEPAKKPCFIMLGGADTVKEECHRWSEHFLARGVATLAVDGPGQGETHATLPMSADYEKAVSTVREWLSDHPAIDSRRIGVWGCSTGGYLAVRAMAFDAQISLGVSVGGFYDARLFPDWPPPTQEAFQRLFWLANLTQTVDYVRENVTLKTFMRRIERPLLIVHGVRDHLVPKAEIHEMADEAPGKTELWAYEDGTHSVWNKLDVAAPRTADWVAEHL
jgi:dipeptidyl aminopeptidase/acylaminoacyl peptidase